MSAPGDSIVSAQTSTSIGAETGIKTIAAVHSQCRSWVISGQTIASQNPRLSAVVRKRTKCCGAANVRYVPKADIPSSAFAKPAGQCNRRQKARLESRALLGESVTWIGE